MGYSNGRVGPGADTAGLRGGPGLVEGIDEACSRMEALDSDIRALLPEADRRSRLLEEAGRLPAEAAAGMPLFGMLVAVKDIIHVDGFETRAGSQLPAEVLAGPEAGCIEALRRAGALVLGKSVTTEFACFKPAATRNPLNLGHTPGGSSSGSAAAVAAGYCPLALGSQTIGSIVRPAAFCGIAGFKPGYGRIEISGFIHCSPSVDTIGTFTRDVATAARAASVLCGEWRTGVSAAGRPVLGIPEGPYLDQIRAGCPGGFRQQAGAPAGYRVRSRGGADLRRHRGDRLPPPADDGHRDCPGPRALVRRVRRPLRRGHRRPGRAGPGRAAGGAREGPPRQRGAAERARGPDGRGRDRPLGMSGGHRSGPDGAGRPPATRA